MHGYSFASIDEEKAYHSHRRGRVPLRAGFLGVLRHRVSKLVKHLPTLEASSGAPQTDSVGVKEDLVDHRRSDDHVAPIQSVRPLLVLLWTPSTQSGRNPHHCG